MPRPPIATPISAAFSDGASFTPSPVMATTAPVAFNALTMRSFCSGMMRAKMVTACTAVRQIGVRHCLKFRTVDHPAALQARLCGDGLRRGRIVAGDHDHPDPRAAAKRHRLRHRGAQGIGKADQTQKAKGEIALAVGKIGTGKTRPLPPQARAAPLAPSRSTCAVTSARAAASSRHRSAIASGAPLAATCQPAPSVAQTCDMARRSGASAYVRTRVRLAPGRDSPARRSAIASA